MIDVTKYVQIARKQTEAAADKLLKAYLEELATAGKATLDEVKKAYGEYLSSVEPSEYLGTMNKNDRLYNLIHDVQEHLDQVDSKKIQNQSKIGTNQYYWMVALAAAFGVELDDIDDAIYYTITARTLDGKVVTVDAGTETLSDYLKRVVKDKATRDDIINKYVAKGGSSTIELIKGLDGDMYDRISKTIKDAISRGASYKELAKELEKQFGYVKYRAELIARTELGRAMAASEYSAWQEMKAQGLEGQRYLIATLDDRTRNQSASMDGKPENAEGLFEYPNGATAAYPRNTGYPQYDINDREAVGFRLPEDTEGDTRAQRDLGQPKSTSQATRSFQQWATDNGLKKNRYGEYYWFAEK